MVVQMAAAWGDAVVDVPLTVLIGGWSVKEIAAGRV
jgi:hypothetical protein